MTETSTMRDGYYVAANATYYVKDGKILKNYKGTFFKAKQSCAFGAVYCRPLMERQQKAFDEAYRKAANA